MKKIKVSKEKLNDALYKKAIGYEANEIVEEYSLNESGDYILSKKKITKKHISPDLTAAKLLLERFSDRDNSEIKSMSDEELLQKKLELINLLSKKKGDESVGESDLE